MPNSPSTDNYVLGKGKLYFDKLSQSTGLYEGERDLGNAPAVNLNITLEELAHYSSRGGLKAKDKKVISEVSPTITFTLDENSKENVALLFMAEMEDVTQAAATALSKSVTPKKNRYFDLDYRNIGVMALDYDAKTVDFNAGSVITGDTSGATATILQVIATTSTVGTLLVSNIVGIFEDNEPIADDGTTPGAATLNGTARMVTTNVSISDGASGFYVQGTDYTVDSTVGRLFITADSNIPDGTAITVNYACAAAEYTRIKGLKETIVEGMLRFVSDNAAGPQQELKIWRTSLVPSGDTALIGDDWSTFSFQGEILKDETGHPDSPYADIIMTT